MPKISVQQVRNQIEKFGAVSKFNRLLVPSTQDAVWPLRLFFGADKEFILNRCYNRYTESTYLNYLKGKLGSEYIRGFNLGFDGFSKKQFGKKRKNTQLFLDGFRDGRRIKRFFSQEREAE